MPTIVEPLGGGKAISGTTVLPLPISGHQFFGNGDVLGGLSYSHGMTADAAMATSTMSYSHGMTMTGDVV